MNTHTTDPAVLLRSNSEPSYPAGVGLTSRQVKAATRRLDVVNISTRQQLCN